MHNTNKNKCLVIKRILYLLLHYLLVSRGREKDTCCDKKFKKKGKIKSKETKTNFKFLGNYNQILCSDFDFITVFCCSSFTLMFSNCCCYLPTTAFDTIIDSGFKRLKSTIMAPFKMYFMVFDCF